MSTRLSALILWAALVIPSASATVQVATVDWTLAETLLALEVTPQAVAQIDAYHAWVAEPALPADVTDLGLRAQPNLELLADLGPDLILISSMFANLTPRLSRIAPVKTLQLYTPHSDTWRQLLEITRDVAGMVDRQSAGERLIRDTEARIEALARRVDTVTEPLLVIQFMDARHVRVFGENGLYHAVLERLALDNAWTRATNRWGFSLVPLEELAGIHARLVIVKPYPEGVERELAVNGLWQRLNDSQNNPAILLPPVWSFGALPSARRFAESLVMALERGNG